MGELAQMRFVKVGHRLLDTEHGQLASLVDEVETAIATGKDESVVCNIYDQLITATERHFQQENVRMYQSGYPDVDRHMALHAGLLNTLLGFAAAPEREPSRGRRAFQATRFLESWLTRHIEEEDSKLATHLHRIGMP